MIVLKGRFEEEKLINYFRTHYNEHSKEHEAGVIAAQKKFSQAHEETGVNPYQETTITIDGYKAHVFAMPLGNRELIVLATPKGILISSARRGNRRLLQKTNSVVQGKLPRREAPANSKVVFTFRPTKAEKTTLEHRVWARYDEKKSDSLSKKKYLKKAGERFRQRIIRRKVAFLMDAMNEMEQTTLIIDRGRKGDMTKTATLVSEFDSPKMAKEVKKKLIKHMVKEIKRNTNVQDKFALGNVSITTIDNKTLVRLELRDSKEQLHAFHLISGYIAKGLLDRM